MNKTIYKILPIALFCGTVPAIQAQTNAKDTTYNRQISVERDFNPTLQDANKINTLPSLYDPVVKKSTAPLASWSVSGNPKLLQLSNTNAGKFGTDIEYDKYRGYAGLRLGTHGNIEAEAGYQAISDEKTKLDIFGTYNASSSKSFKKIDYLLNNADVKANFNDILLKARFEHTFDPFTLYLSSSFNNTGYNYYGSMYTSTPLNAIDYDWKMKQIATLFDVTAGVKSKDGETLRYKGLISYDHFGLKYGNKLYDSSNKGVKSNILQADVNFNTDLGSDYIVGLNAHILSQSVSNSYKDLHSLRHFKFNPYVDFSGSNWKATLGLNAHFTFDNVNKILWVPNVSAFWNFLPTTTIYGSVIGDINENTFIDILRENRYVNPDTRISSSRTYYDAEMGVKSGVVKGLEFNIFAGYKYTSSEHFYCATTVGNIWQNLNSVIYANLNQGKFGGSIKTNLIPYVDLSTKLTTYFYTVKYRNEDPNIYTPKAAWCKPTYTFEMNADAKPIDKLIVTANYLLAGGRKYYDVADDAKKNMKAINELNVKGTYQFTKMVSGTAAINNLLNQSYEISPGYANYGLNFLMGASIKF